MSETDLQLGGGYTYQWECAILLALNYFFEPVRYNPTLFDLVKDFLDQVAGIHLEGEDRESGADLEDINFVNGDQRILIQVKTKQAEGERWTPTDRLLLKALCRFYDSPFFAERPQDTRFVFLTNRPFNPALVQVKDAIWEGTVGQCAEADVLYRYLARYAQRAQGTAVDADRFRQMLARTALVEYLAVDEVKANVQAKLQALGRHDWEQAHAILFEHFAHQSTHIGGGLVTRASIAELLRLPSKSICGEALSDRKVPICTYCIQVHNGDKVRVEVRTPWGQLPELHGEFGLRAETEVRIQELCKRAAAAELESAEVEELGEKLFTALFDNALRLDFLSWYKKIQREEGLLRIELAMDERHLPDVAALPWELIRVPPDARYPTSWLGTTPRVGLSRRRASSTTSEPTRLRSGEPLRIALLVADIDKSKPSPSQDEDMWKSLKRITHLQPGRIELLQPVSPATPDSVDAILEQKPHILHFIGNAQFDVDNQETVAKIALSGDTSDERVWLNPQQFGNLLKLHPPSVIVLQPCESTAYSAPQAFVNIASQLVDEGIPAVVAMQYKIPNSAVRRFASAFYASLAKCEPVDKAAQEGRRSIAREFRGGSYARRDAGAPVLFTGVPDGRLFYRSFHGAPPEIRKVPGLPIHLEVDRTEEITDLNRILKGRAGGGIVIWGRPCAGHKEFLKIATYIMRSHGIIVLDRIDIGDLADAPDREFFLEVLEERLGIPRSREKGQPVSNRGNRLKDITAAIQGRLERSAIALIFFAIQGTDEDTLRWLWENVWIAHLESLASQGLWVLFFSDATAGTQWRKSLPVAVESIALTEIFPWEVSGFYAEYFSMDQLEAEARAGTMFSTLRSRLDRVTPDDVYAALEASVIDLNSRGRGVWL